MTQFLQPVAIMVWKDILLELRSKDIIFSVLVFGLLVGIVFNFALNVTNRILDRLQCSGRSGWPWSAWPEPPGGSLRGSAGACWWRCRSAGIC